MKTASVRLDRFDHGNRLAAGIILANTEAFGGEQAGLVRWSRAVIRRLDNKTFQTRNGLTGAGCNQQIQFFEGERA